MELEQGTMSEKIDRLEKYLIGLPEEQHIKLEPRHYLHAGMYARELNMPSGCLLTGRVHKYAHLNILAKGSITVWTENGMQYLQSPAVLMSDPGMKRVGLCHEDTTWITVHKAPTGMTEDLAEETLTVLDQAQYQQWVEGGSPCLLP